MKWVLNMKKIILILIIFSGNLYSRNVEELVKAIENENLTKIKEPVSAGVDVNEKYSGKPPLIYAIKTGNLEIVKYLLESVI